jgi:hypothetical protein
VRIVAIELDMGLSSEVNKFFCWEVEVLDGKAMFFKEEGGV